MNAPVVRTGFVQRVTDSLYNLMTGLGTDTHDKAVHTGFVVNELDQAQLTAMYRSDWIARKVVRIPAEDETRAWRAWQAEDDQIEAIEEVELAHKLQQKVRKARVLERLFGGSALILGVAGSGTGESELKLDRLKRDCLKFVHVVSRWELTAADGSVEEDPESPWFGQPKMWQRQPIGAAEPVRIHPSRVIRFTGEDYPDHALATSNYGWGESVLQAMYDAVVAAGLVTQGTASLIQEMKVDVIGVKELSHQLATAESTALLRRRFSITNMMKSNNRLTLMDKEDTWDQKQISFGSLPELIQVYLMVASAAADIAATRMLSKSPDGLNATGAGDTRNYYDKVSAGQKNDLTPALSPLDEIIIASATGSRDPSIYYDWRPLWQMTEVEKADVAVKKSQVMAADVAAMLVPADALAKGRQNQLLEDMTYPGLEAAIEDSDGEVISPATEQQMALQQQSHEQGLEQQQVGHENQLQMLKVKPKKPAFGKDSKRYFRTEDEAHAAAGPGQVVVRMRVRAEDAEKLT